MIQSLMPPPFLPGQPGAVALLMLTSWHLAKRKGLEYALIESAKCGCDFTRSLAALVEDKGMRKTRYVVVLLGMMSRWRDIRRKVSRLRSRPLLA